MSKAIAEQSNPISIFWLRKRNCFVPTQKSGGGNSCRLTWTSGAYQSSVSYSITTNMQNVSGARDNMRLQYTHTDRWTGEKHDMDFKIPLVTTPCYYGGVRYWFICPLSLNNQYCGRRIGVIYNIGKWFGCRHCGRIAYSKQMESGKFRWNGISILDIEKAEKEIKRYYYNGKPTRRYRRAMRMNEKFEDGFMMMLARHDKQFRELLISKKVI